MSNTVIFYADTYDGDKGENQPDNKDGYLNGLVYLAMKDIVADEVSSIHGWVRPEVRNLVKAAPELLEALNRLEVSANTVDYCYSKRPENFAAALQALRDDSERARVAIAKATDQ